MEGRIDLNHDFADPVEIIEMLRMFGGLKQQIPMEIIVDNKARRLRLTFNSKDDMRKVQAILENLWDRAVNLLNRVVAGYLGGLKEIGDVDSQSIRFLRLSGIQRHS